MADNEESKEETSKEETEDPRSRWPALESNPEVFTEFIQKLGVPKTIGVHDVFGFDPDLLGFLPQPIYAMILLFPIPEDRVKLRLPENDTVNPDGLWFMWQPKDLGNACGTIACIHAFANKHKEMGINLGDDTVLGKLFKETAQMKCTEKADFMTSFEALREEQCNSASGDNNQTEMEEDVDFHFVCFIEKDGNIIELDGAKDAPLNHGKIETSFAVDCGKVIQKEYMQKMEGNVNFSTLAIAPMEGGMN